MKILAAFLFCLCLVGLGHSQSTKSVKDIQAQINTFKNREKFTLTYDKSKDVTNVVFNSSSVHGMGLGNGSQIIELATNFVYSGEDLKQNSEVFGSRFVSYTNEWKFLDHHSLVFSVDGEKIDFGVGERSGSLFSDGVKESVYFTFNRARFQQLAYGKEVKFQLGNFSGTLKEEQKQTLKDILSLSEVK